MCIVIDRKRFILLISLLLVFYCGTSLGAKVRKEKAGKANFSRSFKDKWGARPIKIRQKIYSQAVQGAYPSSNAVEKAAEKFYKTLDYLPEELIRKSRLKYVTFLRYIKLNGERAAGVASGDTIYLVVDFSEKTLFHEFFHVFDPYRRNPQWTALNDKGFIYTGNKFYKANLEKKVERKARIKQSKLKIARGFVSQYAMSNEVEDRAETFAYMIVEGKKFLRRTKNPVMKGKMEYIMELFIRRNLLSKAFWEKHFDSKFKVKHRFYDDQSDTLGKQ